MSITESVASIPVVQLETTSLLERSPTSMQRCNLTDCSTIQCPIIRELGNAITFGTGDVLFWEDGTPSSADYTICAGPPPAAPANDDCPGALPLNVGSAAG